MRDARSLVEPTDLDAVPPLEFLVEAPFHIARGTVTTLFGLGGVGKSSLAVALAAHIAVGANFLGATVRQGRVFYAEFEGAGQLLARVTRKVMRALEEDHPGAADALATNFVQKHYSPEEKSAWGYARGMIPELIGLLGRQYDVLIFDSYEAATMGDSLDPQVAVEMMMLFARLAKATNAAVILIDHAPKNNKDTVYGSTKKTDFTRVAIRIDAPTDRGPGRLQLSSTKCNVAPPPMFPSVKRNETDLTLRFEATSGFTLDISSSNTHGSGQLEQAVVAARSAGAETRTAVYRAVQAQLDLPTPEAASKRIKRAGLEHLLPPEKRGRRKE